MSHVLIFTNNLWILLKKKSWTRNYIGNQKNESNGKGKQKDKMNIQHLHYGKISSPQMIKKHAMAQFNLSWLTTIVKDISDIFGKKFQGFMIKMTKISSWHGNINLIFFKLLVCYCIKKIN